MGCCLFGLVRLAMFALSKAVFAAVIAIVLSQIDRYLERTGRRDSVAGKAWRMYRSRGGRGVRRGTPPDAGSAIDTRGRPRP